MGLELIPPPCAVGQTSQARFRVDEALIEQFAQLSGDRNPIHVDPEAARAYGYPHQVAHGALLVAFLSKMIGMEVPGPGAVWMNQSIEWLSPVFVGDDIALRVTVERLSTGAGVVGLGVIAVNQKGKTVMRGQVQVKLAERVTQGRDGRPKTSQVALVTGGSRGIGAAIARRLGAAGMAVAVNYRESDGEAERVVQEVQSAGGRAQVFRADLGDPDQTATMMQAIMRAFDQLDVVVHGASPMVEATKITELKSSDLDAFLRVYLHGALVLVEHVVPGMIERRFGRFIFLGTSFMLGMPPVGLTPYLVAKHALWGLVKSMSVELGAWGITSNMVSPSMTVTDFTAEIPARMKAVEAHKNPMRRLATVEDTAELVVFLASESAGFINGANLPLTGGVV